MVKELNAELLKGLSKRDPPKKVCKNAVNYGKI